MNINMLLLQLIEYECRAKEQVLVLMRLGEAQTALRRALQSGDTDLIFTVMDHLRQKPPFGDFMVSVELEYCLACCILTLGVRVARLWSRKWL